MNKDIIINKVKQNILNKVKEKNVNIEKEIILDMQKENFSGDLLDIESENYGIIYNIYKNSNEDFNISYMNNKSTIEEKSYDVCIMFLCFSSIIFKISRKKLIAQIYNALRENGHIYILDVDKNYGKVYNKTVRFLLPNNQDKTVNIKEYNIFKDSSKKSTYSILEKYFDIIDCKCVDNIYYIKARKKRGIDNEEIKSSISGDKL